MFYANKADFYTDTLYSKIKKNHPTLNERIDKLEDMLAAKMGRADKSVIFSLTKNKGPRRNKEIKVNAECSESDEMASVEKKDIAPSEFDDEQTKKLTTDEKAKRTMLNH